MKKSILVFQLLIIINIAMSLKAEGVLDFPQVPERPSFKNLHNSLLKIPIYKFEKPKVMMGIKDIEEEEKNINNISGVLIDSYEKNFKVKPAILFMNSIDSAIESHLSLKYLDINEMKIIAVDNMQNTILINIEEKNKNDTIVQISGYSLVPDNTDVNNIVDKLLLILSDKSKK